MKILEDLIKWYCSIDRRCNELSEELQKSIENKMFDRASMLSLSKTECDSIKKNLKNLIKTNYDEELKERIKTQEKIIKEEVSKNIDMWNTYGSELSGDFNLNEVREIEKLEILKDIFK